MASFRSMVVIHGETWEGGRTVLHRHADVALGAHVVGLVVVKIVCKMRFVHTKREQALQAASVRLGVRSWRFYSSSTSGS